MAPLSEFGDMAALAAIAIANALFPPDIDIGRKLGDNSGGTRVLGEGFGALFGTSSSLVTASFVWLPESIVS